MQSGLIRLSKYDLKFLQNLLAIYTSSKQLTTNQVALFHKLVGKYERQLTRHKITKNLIDSLVWTVSIIDSDPKCTEAYISIKDGFIYFKSPFNKKFVEGFKKIQFNNFVWDKTKKQYECPYSSLALKILVDASHELYPIVNYCPITKGLLDNLVQTYDKITHWSPTLVKVKNQYMISCINPYLAEAVKDIKLSGDPGVVSKLVTYGVSIDKSIIGDDPLLKFCSAYRPEVDITELDFLFHALQKIGCDGLFIGRGMGGLHNKYKNKIKEKLAPSNIILDEDLDYLITDRVKKYQRPVLISFMLKHDPMMLTSFEKVIKISNSLPIPIK